MSPAATSDPLALLIPRIADGDRAALQQLYQETSAKLFAGASARVTQGSASESFV